MKINLFFKSLVILVGLSTSSCKMLSGLMSGGPAPALPPSGAPTFDPNGGGGTTPGGIPLADPLALTRGSKAVSEEGYARIGYMATTSARAEARDDASALYGIFVER